MGHILTIESDEAFALASELAALRGETVEAALMHALRMKVAEERDRFQRQERIKRIRAITAEMRALMPDPAALDTDMLYDEHGLPF